MSPALAFILIVLIWALAVYTLRAGVLLAAKRVKGLLGAWAAALLIVAVLIGEMWVITVIAEAVTW